MQIEGSVPKLEHPQGYTLVLDVNTLYIAFRAGVTADKVTSLQEFGIKSSFEASNEDTSLVELSEMWAYIDDDLLDISRNAQEFVDQETNNLIEFIAPVYVLLEEDSGEEERCACLPNSILIKYNDNREELEADIIKDFELIIDDARSALLEKIGYLFYECASKLSISVQQELRQKYGQQIEVELEFKRKACIWLEEASAEESLDLDQIIHLQKVKAKKGLELIEQAELPSNPVPIAILDTGCCNKYLNLVDGVDLKNMRGSGKPANICTKKNHGTRCAYIAAGRPQITPSVSGLAQGFPVIPIAFHRATDVEVVLGILHAVEKKARVVSMSFGQQGTVLWNTALIDRAIEYAIDNHQIVICAASGNNEAHHQLIYPASHPKVIAVGASNAQDQHLPISNYSNQPDNGISVVAPGENVRTLDLCRHDEYVDPLTGTSAAAPLVAGLAALILSMRPKMSSDEVRTAIEKHADKIGALANYQNLNLPNGTWSQQLGYGRINVHKTLENTI